MGGIRVVPGVLDHDSLPPGAVAAVAEQGDGQAPASGEAHLHRFRTRKTQEFAQGPLDGGGGSRTGGESHPESFAGTGELDGAVILRLVRLFL
jgi:hypothetical protein